MSILMTTSPYMLFYFKMVKRFINLFLARGLKFSIEEKEMEDISRNRGLINFWVQFDGQHTFHLKEYDTGALNDVLKFKHKELEKEVK